MTKTDPDTVEALAKRHDDDAGAWAMDGGRSDLARYHRDTAATLRALLARAEKAEAALAAAVLAEREACAKMARYWPSGITTAGQENLAAAIRARGETQR